jgi:hypothetical protein
MHARTIALACALLSCSSGSEGTSPSAAPSQPARPPADPPAPTPSGDDESSSSSPSSPQVPLGLGKGGGGPPIALGHAGDDDCTFDLAYTIDAPANDGSPLFTLTLTKRDTREGTCTEDKGKTVLVASSYELPVAFIAKHAREKMIVVAFDGRYAHDSAVYTRLVQIDWATGARLHEGEMAVTGTSPFPVPQMLRPKSLAVDDRDVILDILGPLPGAGDGESFRAVYSGFLGPDPQLPSPASYVEPD